MVFWLVFTRATWGAPETFFQITDTHVADDSNHGTQKTNLKNLVDWANILGGKIKAVINSGDLADFVSKKSDLEVYFSEANRLVQSRVEIPGNHDYQTSNGITYGSLGYENYSVLETDNWYMVGSPPANNVEIDWARLEANLAANKGKKNLALLQHFPFLTPSWLSCNGGACTAPKWVLSSDSAQRFRELMTKYDVNTVFSGHVHAHYFLIDKDQQFDQIVAADLGKANGLALIAQGGNRLFTGYGKRGNMMITVTNPGQYDGDSGWGKIYEAGPVRVKVVSEKEISKVSFKVGSWGNYLTMSSKEEGWYEGSYEWGKLTKNSWYYLYVKASAKDGTTREINIPIMVGGEYPNSQPMVNLGTGQSSGDNGGLVNIDVGFTDDGADTTEGSLFIDGVKRMGWAWRGGVKTNSNSYQWDTTGETSGEHLVVYQTKDKFGRRTYSEKVSVWLEGGSQPAPTPTAEPSPTLVEPTITPTLSPGVTSAPSAEVMCVPGSTGEVTLSREKIRDTYIFSTAKSGDTLPEVATQLKVSGYYPSYRTLSWFDLAQIPTGATVTEASLNIFVYSWDPANNIKPTYKMAALGKNFTNTASWEKASESVNWTKAGAKRVDEDYWANSVVNRQIKYFGANKLDVTDMVGNWVNSTRENMGLLIWEEDSRSANYYSSEYSDPAKAQNLTVKYKCP